MKELIQLCWNTGDQGQSGEYDDRMNGVADVLFSVPTYGVGKRVGSLLLHQARTNSILKSVCLCYCTNIKYHIKLNCIIGSRQSE